MKDFIVIKHQNETVETFNTSTPLSQKDNTLQFSGWPFIYDTKRIQRLINCTNKKVDLTLHSFSDKGQVSHYSCLLQDVDIHKRILTLKLKTIPKQSNLFDFMRNLFNRATTQGYSNHHVIKTLKS